MRRLFLILICLSLPVLVWAVSAPDLVAQAQAKKTHGDFRGAVADYTAAIAQNPRNAAAYLGRANIYSLEANYAPALADDNKAISIDPKNASAYSNRGNVRMYQGDLAGAIADFNKAIALDPHHVHALINRGSVKNLQKKYAAAIEDYSAAIALDPKSVVAFYDRAGAKRSLGDYAGAKADYSKAIELNPVDVHAYINRAVLEIAPRNWPSATADLNKAAGLIPAERQAYICLYRWVISIKEGNDPVKATAELAAEVAKVAKPMVENWGWEIAGFVAGQETEKAFLDSAKAAQAKKDKGQVAQAYYYAGMKRILAGNQVGAAKFFRDSISLGNPSLHEYTLAQKELKVSGGGHP